MGNGYVFRCEKCKREYEINLGCGFLFPDEYQKCIRAIKRNKYGIEWRRLLLQNKYNAIDAERYLYVCRQCGYWEVNHNLSLYFPVDIEKIENERYEKRVAELGYLPYVMVYQLREYFALLKKFSHRCPKCCNEMKEYSDESMIPEKLKCKKCGSDLIYESGLKWD